MGLLDMALWRDDWIDDERIDKKTTNETADKALYVVRVALSNYSVLDEGLEYFQPQHRIPHNELPIYSSAVW